MIPPKKIYGLIGYPVKHSLSPLMHNAAFLALSIPAEYRLFELEPAKLETFLVDNIKILDTQGKEFYSQDIAGFNITIPHKVRACEILKKEFPLSFGTLAQVYQYYVKLSGAVNTVKREGGQLLYYNTDAEGFLRSLEDKEEGWGLGFKTKGKSALVIGSGGAGRAVLAALSWKDKDTVMEKIYITDINPNALEDTKKHFLGQDRSQEWVDWLTQKLKFITSDKIPETIEKCDLLVNASPVGMENDEGSLVPKHLIEKNKKLSVYDVVYNRTTQLVKDAKSLDRAAVGGKGMLLYQGVLAFEFWTGRPAPVEIMRQAINVSARHS